MPTSSPPSPVQACRARTVCVCMASLPICSAHGLPKVLLVSPPSDSKAAREAVAAHGVTDVVATDARQPFRRRLPWVELMEMSGSPEKGMEAAEAGAGRRAKKRIKYQ
ncbi:hypothetical protein ABZP36_024249 [Zizania latifolia]